MTSEFAPQEASSHNRQKSTGDWLQFKAITAKAGCVLHPFRLWQLMRKGSPSQYWLTMYHKHPKPEQMRPETSFNTLHQSEYPERPRGEHLTKSLPLNPGEPQEQIISGSYQRTHQVKPDHVDETVKYASKNTNISCEHMIDQTFGHPDKVAKKQ